MNRREFIAGAGTLAAIAALKETQGAEILPRKHKVLRWEELTAEDFVKAREATGGVCLVPLSCLEKHGRHLPIGTDYYIATEYCERAAAMEPAVVFPPIPFGCVSECRHVAGTIGLRADTMLNLLRETCEEIGRNGFTKIVLVNGHGGNEPMLHYFMRSYLDDSHPYNVYFHTAHWEGTDESDFAKKLGPGEGFPRDTLPECGHGGVQETSLIMAVKPETVHMERAVKGEGHRLERLAAFKDKGVEGSLDWYADYPTHLQGDPFGSNVEAGEFLFDLTASKIARNVRLIKADKVTKELVETYRKATENPGL